MPLKPALTNDTVHRIQEMNTAMDMGQEEQTHVHEIITTDMDMDEEEEHVYEEIIEVQYKEAEINVNQEIENTSGGFPAILPKPAKTQPCCPVNIQTSSPPYLQEETRKKTPPLPPKPGTILLYYQLYVLRPNNR